MKISIVFAALFAVAFAAPAVDDSQAEILYQYSDTSPDGYKFAYETSDGQTREEEGILATTEDGQKVMGVRGSYPYTAPDGLIQTVSYIADGKSFRVEGDYLPRLP